MVIIFDKSLGNILKYMTRVDKNRQKIFHHCAPYFFRLRGEIRKPYPYDYDDPSLPIGWPRYSWQEIEDKIGHQHVENRSLARLIVADLAPVLDFNPRRRVLGITLTTGEYFTRGQMQQHDHGGP